MFKFIFPVFMLCPSIVFAAELTNSSLKFSVEIGGGVASSRFSGAQNFTTLDQPILIGKNTVIGGYGFSYSAAAWVSLVNQPRFMVGLEYQTLNYGFSYAGEADQGAGVLSDPTFLKSKAAGQRKEFFLNFGWKPYLSDTGQSFIAIGIGLGRDDLKIDTQVSSDFLGVIKEQDAAQQTVTSLQFALGYDMALTDHFYMGMRAKYIYDLTKNWANEGLSVANFMIVAGYRFGSFEQPKSSYFQKESTGYRVESSFERMQGSYGFKIKAQSVSPLGKKQPLEFDVKNMINAQSYLMSFRFWKQADFICDDHENSKNSCPFEMGLEFIHQFGKGYFNSVISAEGPLSTNDQNLEIMGRISSFGMMANLAFSPQLNNGFQPQIAIGLGLNYYTATAQNNHIDKNVFSIIKTSKIKIAAQILMGLKYKVSPQWTVGLTSRFMVKQLSFGGHLSYVF